MTDLRETHKVRKGKPVEINKGNVVLIQDDNVKRGQWKMRIIEGLISGRDGQVRGARVRRLGRGKLEFVNRPLPKLFPLEISRDDDRKERSIETLKSKYGMGIERDENNEKGDNIPIECANGTRNRLPRAAAKDARWKSKLMLDT